MGPVEVKILLSLVGWLSHGQSCHISFLYYLILWSKTGHTEPTVFQLFNLASDSGIIITKQWLTGDITPIYNLGALRAQHDTTTESGHVK